MMTDMKIRLVRESAPISILLVLTVFVVSDMAEPRMDADERGWPACRAGPIRVRPRLVGIVPPIRMQDDFEDRSHDPDKPQMNAD